MSEEVTPKSPGDVTRLLNRLQKGDRGAESQLVPLVYGELRRLASAFMRHERPGHTLQSTALVHEAYIRLSDQKNVSWQNRAHFFAVAAQLMRRILVDHARARLAQKRGARPEMIQVDEAYAFTPERSNELLALDEALNPARSARPPYPASCRAALFRRLDGRRDCGSHGDCAAHREEGMEFWAGLAERRA